MGNSDISVIWTEDLVTSLAKMDLGASSCPFLWGAGTFKWITLQIAVLAVVIHAFPLGISMTSLQVVMVLVQTQGKIMF